LIHNLLFFRGQAKYTGHRGFGMKTMQELPGDREGVCIVGGFAARTEAAWRPSLTKSTRRRPWVF